MTEKTKYYRTVIVLEVLSDYGSHSWNYEGMNDDTVEAEVESGPNV